MPEKTRKRRADGWLVDGLIGKMVMHGHAHSRRKDILRIPFVRLIYQGMTCFFALRPLFVSRVRMRMEILGR